jgi:hypothetical protein
MRQSGNLAQKSKVRKGNKILVENPEVWNHVEDLGTDGKIILKWILRKQAGILVTQNSVLQGALVNMVMTIQVP